MTQEIDERVPRTEPDLLGPFRRQWASALTTYKRDGTPVGTAVNIAVEGTRAFFRTYEQSWKFKRLRCNPGVEIAPATVTGQPVAPSVRARARGDECGHALLLGDLVTRLGLPHEVEGETTCPTTRR